MFAIIEYNGKQYKVSKGDHIVVDRMDVKVDSEHIFKEVLLFSDNDSTQVGTPFTKNIVKAKVIGDKSGKKLRIVKQKAKKRCSSVQGYKAKLTELEITSIEVKK